MTLGFVALLMVGNLRGVREAGRIFAAPTYFFIASMLLVIGVGAWRYCTGSLAPVAAAAGPTTTSTGLLTTFAILTAFSTAARR